MALSTAVFVGGIEPWKDSLIEKASKLKVAPGQEEGADVGPLISPEARQRCIDLISSAEKDVSSWQHRQSHCMAYTYVSNASVHLSKSCFELFSNIRSIEASPSGVVRC